MERLSRILSPLLHHLHYRGQGIHLLHLNCLKFPYHCRRVSQMWYLYAVAGWASLVEWHHQLLHHPECRGLSGQTTPRSGFYCQHSFARDRTVIKCYYSPIGRYAWCPDTSL